MFRQWLSEGKWARGHTAECCALDQKPGLLTPSSLTSGGNDRRGRAGGCPAPSSWPGPSLCARGAGTLFVGGPGRPGRAAPAFLEGKVCNQSPSAVDCSQGQRVDGCWRSFCQQHRLSSRELQASETAEPGAFPGGPSSRPLSQGTCA